MDSSQWSDELDRILAARDHPEASAVNGWDIGTMVSLAYSNGAIGGVTICTDADDDYGRLLISDNHQWGARFVEARGCWIPLNDTDIAAHHTCRHRER